MAKHDSQRVAKLPGSLVLALASVLGTTVVIEISLRIGAELENRGLLTVAAPTSTPPSGSRVTLGQIIRRSAHPRIIYELKPGLRHVLYAGGSVTTNTHGFRGREAAVASPSGALRIVGLGDSYMFGQGVSDAETYLARLESDLRSRPATANAETINTAVPGYNTVMEVATLRAKGLAWRPDLIVLEVVGNDFDLPNFIRVPEDATSLRRSFAAEFVRRRLRLLDGEAETPAGLLTAPEEPIPGGVHFLDDPVRVPPEYRDMVGVPAWENALVELRDLAAANAVPVVILTEGVDFERRLWRLSRDHGFHFLDMSGTYRRFLREGGYRDFLHSPLAVGRGDPHPSALAHSIIARALLAYLDERRLLDRRPS